MKNRRTFLAVFLTLATPWAGAYELATHGAITYHAYLKSNLNTNPLLPNPLLQDLGIDGLLVSPDAANPFGIMYYDVQGNTISERSRDPFERDIMLRIKNVDPAPLTLPGWLMRGAIREDDLGYLLGIKIGANPHDDPYGDINRVFNHFFDPYFNRALTYVPGAKKAPDWASGSSDVFTQPNTPDTARRNHFTVFDAREAMYRALTGKTKGGANAGPNETVATESIRKAYWATTFRALGDILHLNQDMAQPQHTRNEPHSGKGGWLIEELLSGHASVMEDYIEARATGASYTLNGQVITPAPLVYDTSPTAYPIPVFSKYSDYWSTGPGSDSVTGKGLADYSNCNTLADTAA